MNLARDFHEAAGRIQMLDGFIIGHSLDDCDSHAFGAEVIQRMLNEPPAEPVSLCRSVPRDVWNAAFAGVMIDPRGDIAEYLAVFLSDKHARGIDFAVLLDFPRLAPAPIVFVDEAA